MKSTIELTANQQRSLDGKRPLSNSYAARHWRGELSLARSYWCNLILLAFAIRFVCVILFATAPLAAILFVAFWLIVIPWQLVGVWRAAKYYTGFRGYAHLAMLSVVCYWLAYGYFILISLAAVGNLLHVR